MSARILRRRAWRVVLHMAAGALLAGMSAQIGFAQRPAVSDVGGAAHAAPSGKNKRGSRVPHLNIAPAKARSIVHGAKGANVIDRNAIGLPIHRPDAGQRPATVNLGRAAAVPVPGPSGGAIGSGNRGLQVARIPAPAPRPPVWGHGTLNGTAFTKPRTALGTVGGPAKPATARSAGRSPP